MSTTTTATTADLADLVKKCPAFQAKDGGASASCPFKESPGKMTALTQSMPASHTTAGSEAHQAIEQALASHPRPRGGSFSKPGSLFSALDELARDVLGADALARVRSSSIDAAEAAAAAEPALPLSTQLKTGTQEAHTAAESGTFVKRLLRGKVEPREYRLLVVDLLHVYVACRWWWWWWCCCCCCCRCCCRRCYGTRPPPSSSPPPSS